MNNAKKYSILILSTGIVAFTCYGLYHGLPWLEVDILSGFPLGNIATSGAFIGLGVLTFLSAPDSSKARYIARFILIANICWYPIGILWSGNIRLDFSLNGEYWLPFSAALAVINVVFIIGFLLYRLFKMQQKK